MASSGGGKGGSSSSSGKGSSSSSSSKDSKSSSSSSSKSSGGGFFDSLGKGLESIGRGISSAFGGGSGGKSSGGSSYGGGRDSYSSKDSGLGGAKAAAASSKTADRDRVEKTKDKDMDPKGGKGKYSGNAATIAGELSKAGLSDQQISGFMGRLQQESSLNPGATRKNDAGKGKDSYGIGQWNRDRLDNLSNYAKAMGKDKSDLATQASFAVHEMFGSKDSRVAGKYGDKSEAYAGQQLSKAQTVSEAARAAMHYERPQGYTRSNPTAGHGWNNTVNYASNFAKGAGLNTDVRGGAQAVAATATAAQNLSNALDPTTTASMSAPKTPSSMNSYVDPVVKAVGGDVIGGAIAAIENIGSGIGLSSKKADPTNTRHGVAGVVEDFKNNRPLEALTGIAGAIASPGAFAAVTLADAAINKNFGLDGLKNLAGTPGASQQAGLFAGSGGDNTPRVKGGDQVAFAPETAAPETPASQPVKRKPFSWSLLT